MPSQFLRCTTPLLQIEENTNKNHIEQVKKRAPGHKDREHFFGVDEGLFNNTAILFNNRSHQFDNTICADKKIRHMF